MSVNEKIIKSTITTCTTLNNNDVSLTSSKCHFHEKINIYPVRCGKTADWIWMPFGVVGRLGPRMRQSDGIGDCPTRRCTKHASLISTTSNITSKLSGQAGSRRHCCSCASVASMSFSLCEGRWWSFRALLLILTFEQLSVDILV